MKYQSRLFNFLNRGAIAFNDRLGQTARSLKMAASWGVQLLVYPFYVLVQTGRWTQTQIKSKFEENKYQLPTQKNQDLEKKESFQTDEIIINILKEINPSPPFDQGQKGNPHPPSPLSLGEKGKQEVSKIRGISCLLSDKSLVLVGENNTILNILTSEQQHKLEQLIISKNPQYKHFQPQKNHQLAFNLPLISDNNNQSIVIIRWFRKVIEWVQVGSLAQKIDLFGESHLIINNDEKEHILSKLTEPTEIIFNKLDSQIAKIENEIEGEIIENEDPFQIKVLIFAAIDHFFGDKNNPKNGLKTDFNKPQLPKNNQEKEPDPWLSWDDFLPQKAGKNMRDLESEKPLNFAFLTGDNQPKLKNNPFNNLKNKLNQQKDNFLKFVSGKNDSPSDILSPNKPTSSENSLIKLLSRKEHPPTENQSTFNDNFSHLPKKQLILSTFTKQNKTELETINNNQEEQTNNIKHNPQWIETEAKYIGYEKNLLEIVLSLLDKIILIIEELIIIVVSILGKIFKKKDN